MKKNLLLFILLPFLAQAQPIITSSDPNIVNSFNWAKTTSFGYRGNATDPVGPWYECSLPSRESFCMRDASHQCIGAEIIGETAENKNMFQKFADNISISRDYCSYWEITRYNTPTPVDYTSDTDFWYNLPGNMDMIGACWRLYQWTGDISYIQDAKFQNFFQLSLNQYISKWQLDTLKIMSRTRIMNGTISRRGIASYVESVSATVGVDLIAALYQGNLAYSNIIRATGGSSDSIAKYEKIAMGYARLLDRYWWNTSKLGYNTYRTSNATYGKDEGEQYLMWFDVIKNPTRKQYTLTNLANTTWNIETMSYYPVIFYNNGFGSKAYDYLMYITNPNTPRRDYPESPHGAIQGVINGLMGIKADAFNNTISTMPQLVSADTWVQAADIPVFGKKITVKHQGNYKTTFTNNLTKTINWRACFKGDFSSIIVNTTPTATLKGVDESGNIFSYVDTDVAVGTSCVAYVDATGETAPTANFSADNTTISVNESINFSNLSTGNITQTTWSFTGTDITNGKAYSNNLTLSYKTPGNYTVTLSVGNIAGASTKTVNITVTAFNNLIPYSKLSVQSFDSQDDTGVSAAKNAIDGNVNTIWHTQWNPTVAPIPHEIQINLGGNYALNGFSYVPRSGGGNGTIAQYEISTSTDATNWSVKAQGTWSSASTEKFVSLSTTAVRYLKLKAIKEVNNNQFTSAAEIRIYGVLDANSAVVNAADNRDITISSIKSDLIVNLKGSSTAKVVLTDIQGKPINSFYIREGTNTQNLVLSKGIYIAQVISNNDFVTKKIRIN